MKHSNKVDARPSLQWYPSDPLADTGLRASSLAARGAWYDMLWFMFDSPERGVLLKQNGSKPSSKELARMMGCECQEMEEVLAELWENGVYSKLDNGAIYNRRMRGDEDVRQVKIKAGAKGGSASRGKQNASKPPSKSEAKGGSSTSTSSPTPGIYTSFGKVWGPYPRKEGENLARKYCAELVDYNQATWPQLVQCVLNYRGHCSKNNTQPKFIFKGSTFFGPNGSWKDYLGEGPEVEDFSSNNDSLDQAEVKAEARRKKQLAEVLQENLNSARAYNKKDKVSEYLARAKAEGITLK